MTGVEKLDFTELRREVREGFKTLGDEIHTLATRVQSLEFTRAEEAAVIQERQRVEAEKEKASESRRLSRGQLTAAALGIVTALYGGARLLHDLKLF